VKVLLVKEPLVLKLEKIAGVEGKSWRTQPKCMVT
jgi:hypothetical protein